MKNDCNRSLQVKTLMYGLERELFLMDAFDLFLFLFDLIIGLILVTSKYTRNSYTKVVR